MPHVVMEYSAGLEPAFDARAALVAVNAALAGCGEFAAGDIKSRALRCDTVEIGDGGGDATFVHVRLQLLSGRDLATRRRLTVLVLDALQHTVAPRAGLQVSVEAVEIERDSYAKRSF
ncbi:5-carboxymethyl-2-hydroxymuconate Delta-isomerase [Crenobacter cavernae]|nr:5-carboxymethyl-2-hydroxymuconate Delta-isomerase [Crenobacter cavernae]